MWLKNLIYEIINSGIECQLKVKGWYTGKWKSFKRDLRFYYANLEKSGKAW